MKEVITQVCNALCIARNEAELIIATLLDTPRFELYHSQHISEPERTRLMMRIDQLKHGVPIEYITKRACFRDLTLRIVPGVFIPRVETEYFIDLIAREYNDPPDAILDIGTGTGAIAIALARCFLSSTVIATDLTTVAIECAQDNVQAHGLLDRVQVVQTSMLDGIDRDFDLIVSNPPYVPFSRLQSLPKSVKCYEPIRALNGGKEGIMFTQDMIGRSISHLRDDGIMAIEIDEDAVPALRDVIRRYNTVTVDFKKDLCNTYRYMFLRKVK